MRTVPRWLRRAAVLVVYVTVVGSVSWAVWENDQANAERVTVIDKALVECQRDPLAPVSRRSWFD